ncbi:hypothetical protein [Saccharothrix australiensis]|uniref:Class 3 adenylate cyclase n=1 Tax=Saccharothrix australiensis TaxID=2072 RepID=A0A495VYH1_9PSEU|nr:hypothetical protein [Saccharothrix australiensis]RKT54254.1 hypothetical protein C8E97_2870 [Saccharothrix australiensis]
MLPVPRRSVVPPAHHRAILAVDVERSTALTNPGRARMRHSVHDLLVRALAAGGVGAEHHEGLVDTGDGVLALLRPVEAASKARLLGRVVPTLSRLLDDHRVMVPDEGFRLRVVVHAGEVHRDRYGWFGEALDVAFRLLNAPATKERLRTSAGALVLVVSDEIHRSVVRHGYDGIDATAFEPLRDPLGPAGWTHLPVLVRDREGDRLR